MTVKISVISCTVITTAASCLPTLSTPHLLLQNVLNTHPVLSTLTLITSCTLCLEIVLPLHVLLWTIDFLKQEGFYIILDCLTFGDGPAVCPETSANNYQHMLCNILEQQRPQGFCLFTLASRVFARPWKCTLFFIICIAFILNFISNIQAITFKLHIICSFSFSLLFCFFFLVVR